MIIDKKSYMLPIKNWLYASMFKELVFSPLTVSMMLSYLEY